MNQVISDLGISELVNLNAVNFLKNCILRRL